jgi:hypothetical protein
VIVVYGLWTVVSTMTTMVSGTPRVGLGGGVVAIFALAVVAALPRVRRRWLGAYLSDLRSVECLAPVGSDRLRGLLLLGAAGVVAAWLLTRSALLVWSCALIVCAAVIAVGARERVADEATTDPSPPIASWQMAALHAIALLCGLFTLLTVRPRTDDPFYVNMSVAVADFPDRPLLAVRTMHGPSTATLPLQPMFPPYRVHSFESLGGYLSHLTGIDAIAVVHFGMATFFGWFAVFAIARLMRIATPRYWLLALLVTIAYYWIEGTAGRGYSNQAFVRLFHGKSVMLTAAVPLILAYGIRFGLRPTPPRFALLALAQISAMGMTSTAIWLAPMLAMFAVVGATPQLKRIPLSALLSAASSFYVVGMALWVRMQMSTDTRNMVAARAAKKAGASFIDLAFSRLGYVMKDVLGVEHTPAALLVVAALGCLLAEKAAVFRVLGAISFFLVAFMINPWLGDFVASSITGSLTYERVFWLLPVPVALGLAVAGTIALLRDRIGLFPASAVAAVALAMFFVVATQRLVVSKENNAWLKYPPALKVGAGSRRVALAVCGFAPLGHTVLASETISRQLAMIHRCGHPLIAGMRWMSAPIKEERRRMKLQRYVSERRDLAPDEVDLLRQGLTDYQISVVVMTAKAMGNRSVKYVLKKQRFKKIKVVEKHHIYALDEKHAGRPLAALESGPP